MDTALDVTVISPLANYCRDRTLRDPDFALAQAHREKWRITGEACRRQSVAFIPLPVETFGAWHDGAVDQLVRLARDLARKTCATQSVTIKHLFQRLSVLPQRGNATLLLSRQPYFPSAVVDGDI